MSHFAAKIFTNALSGWARLCLQIIIFAFLTPFIIGTIGKEEFGLWAFALSVVSFCELFDFGLSTTAVKYVAHTQVERDVHKQNRILSTLFFCCIGFAVLGALALGIYRLLFPHMIGAAFLLVVILGFRLFAVTLPFSIFRGILIGDQKFVVANAIAFFCILLYAALVFLSLREGYGVLALGVCNLIGGAVEYALYTVFAYRYLPNLSVSLMKADLSLVSGEIFSFSASQFFANVGSLVLNNSDLIIVKIFFPLSTVAFYAIALRLTTYGYMLVKQFINVLTPVIVSLDASNQHDKLAKLFTEGSRVALFFSTPILILSVVIGKPFLVLWLGHDFAPAAPILIILVFALWLRTLYMMTSDMLQMTGFHLLFVWFFGTTIVVHLSCACIFPFLFSLPGVALGSLCSALTGLLLFFPRACKQFSIDWRQYFVSLFKTFFPASCAMAAFLYAVQIYWPIDTWILFLTVCAAAAAIYLGVLWMTGLSYEEKRSLLYIIFRYGDENKMKIPNSVNDEEV